jgi:hypothetical protein
MPLTPSSAGHTTVAGNDRILTFTTGGGDLAQGMAMIDAAGAHSGIDTNPAVTKSRALTYSQSGATALKTVQVSAAAGVLGVANAIILSNVTAARYLMIFDKATAPVTSDVPTHRALIPPGGQAEIEILGHWAFALGCQLAVSTAMLDYQAPTIVEAVFTWGVE